MGKKGKSYRGQRAKKDIGCGCWLCTGHDKEDRTVRLQQLIDEETAEEVNNFILPDVIKCDCEDNNYALVEITENLCLECNKPIK